MGPQTHEQVVSKLAALLGNNSRVATAGIPFTHVDCLRMACERLRENGYPALGREPMYSGITGERLDGDVFLGMVYYQRLRHMPTVSPEARGEAHRCHRAIGTGLLWLSVDKPFIR